MRVLFGLLLLLSIVLFLLMQWGEALTGAGKNVLTLPELNPEKIILLDKPVAAQLPASAVTGGQSAVEAAVPVATPLASAPASSEPLAPVPVPASAPAKAMPPVLAAVSAPSPSPQPPKLAIVPPLQPVKPPVPAPATVAVKAIAKSCMEWGEFSGADLERVSKTLSTLNLGEHLVRRTVEYASGYWVHIPPLKNKAAVKRKIAEIKALGIEDYFVVHEPPRFPHVISLGVFKTSEAAKSYLADLKKKGIRTAIVGERKQKLKFIVFEFRQIEIELSARLTKLQKEYAYSELKTLPCKN